MRFSLRQLELFVAVARAGSATAAGEQVALSQSAVSAAVAELERVISASLFDRVGKRLVLNDEGRRLLPHALRVLDGARDIEQDFTGAVSAGGWLRIGASRTIGSYVLPPMLAAWLRQARWRIDVRVANTREIVDAVDVFDVDLGLIEGTCHAPGLITSPWLEDALVVVASPHDPIAVRYAGAQVPLPALREARWLLREPGSGTREAVEQLLLAHLDGTADTLTIDDAEAIKRCVAEGAGLSCLSRWAVADLLDAGRLVELDTALPPMSRRFHIVRHRDKRPSRTMSAFLVHLGQAAVAGEPQAAVAGEPAPPG